MKLWKHGNAREADNTAQAGSRDDMLFEALGRSKKRKRRKIIRTMVIVAVVAAVGLTVGVRLLQRQVRMQFAANASEVLSGKATVGTISTVVSGSGQLNNVDTETVSVPSGVEVTEVLVAYGDTVQEGELLALVDMASVRSAMSDLQTQIDELDDQIADAEGDTVSSYIRAGVPGRLKRLNAGAGDVVADVMVEHGALAVISLDGYMAVDLEADGLSAGETVTVLRSDGEEIQGTVESAVNGRTTVLLTDNGPEYGEEVTVQKGNTVLGTGNLYIHNPLQITGYAGTVKTAPVALNAAVTSYTTLFTLTDTSDSASYDALLRSRSDLEEDLLELLRIQKYGGLTAPISGSVYAVADLENGETTEFVTLSPDQSMSVTLSVDESDILSLELGQQATVTVSSLGEGVLNGTVTEIDKTASDGSYTAVVTLDKVSGMLPGMTASVSIRIQGVENAILIPVEAIHQTSSGAYVYTSYDEETESYGGKVDVVVGLTNDNYAEIKSGLAEGDTVYYTEQETFDFGKMPGGNAFGGMSGGGNMPSGSNMPSGMPSGNMPGGGSEGGDRMPGGNGGGMPGSRG